MPDHVGRAEATDKLTVGQGTFVLGRPAAGNAPVRAWDAADEYVLDHVLGLEEGGDDPSQLGRTILVNDDFGALGTALAQTGSAAARPTAPVSLGDSCLAPEWLAKNLARNDRETDSVAFVPSLGELPERVDLAVVKVPKTLGLLEHQLHRLRPLMHSNTVVVGAGMTRHVHTSTIELFERIVGPTSTSLARKKARLIHATIDDEAKSTSPWPKTLTFEGHEITCHAGVFSSGRIDPASQLLIEAMRSAATPDGRTPSQVVDLGCGNGVLGLAVSLAYPESALHFSDVSYLAVESARSTWLSAWGDKREASFAVQDGLRAPSNDRPVTPTEVDLVVNNPPFHEGHLRGDEIAWRMFADSHRVLRKGGALLVVGNRHLGYHSKLKRRFGNCETVLSNQKFVVLRSIK